MGKVEVIVLNNFLRS